VVSSHLRVALERALAALPLADRELIVLVGVEGLAPQEAALVLSIRPEALRKRLERARAKMRQNLPDWSDDEAHR
jgi:RNA polymerase sigma-70 factor (ECF subfamily)